MMLEMTAKVEEINPGEEGVDRVRLALNQYEEKDWAKYLGLFSNRQNEIEDFLKAARGY
jgi:hypothetical protein